MADPMDAGTGYNDQQNLATPQPTQPFDAARYQQSMFDPSRDLMRRTFADAIQSQFRKPSRWERGMQVGQDIYRNLAAPMVGIFGPAGFETGTSEWIKSEQKRQDDLRIQKNKQRNDSIQGLTGLADIMGRADKSRMDEFAQMMKLYKMQQSLPYEMSADQQLAEQRHAQAGAYNSHSGYFDAQRNKSEAETQTINNERDSKVAAEKSKAEKAAESVKTQKEMTGLHAKQSVLAVQKGSLVGVQTETARARTRNESAKVGATQALERDRTARATGREARNKNIKVDTTDGATKPIPYKNVPKVGRAHIDDAVSKLSAAGATSQDIDKYLRLKYGTRL